jgi:F0F1-type ATP synthase membrane subunit b/b'
MLNMRKLITIIVLVLGVSACCAFASDVEDAATEPSEGGKIDLFGGWIGESIWTLVAFVVLLLVLYKLAWKPLLAGLQGRQDYIEKQISDADETRRQAEKYLAEYRAKLAGVEEEGKGIIAEHISKAEQEGKKVSAKTQKALEVM